MDAEFWKARWQSNEIGFHEGRTNAMLAKHWPALGLKNGSSVFVPLCGKSADLAWFAAQGHRVLGVELSEVAVATFFTENGLEPKRESRDGFEVSSAGGIEIWCGDFFKIEPRHLSGITGAYDRASLVAMPPTMQPAYAAKMAEIVPRGLPTLLVTFTLDEAQPIGPPFSTPPARVRTLFDANFEISELESKDTDEVSANMRVRGITHMKQHAIVLRRR
jgi:thiopurine S-methyltransferase